MKLGFLGVILFDHSFKKVIDLTSDSGFNCAELIYWPENDKSERYYSEVTHINGFFFISY